VAAVSSRNFVFLRVRTPASTHIRQREYSRARGEVLATSRQARLETSPLASISRIGKFCRWLDQKGFWFILDTASIKNMTLLPFDHRAGFKGVPPSSLAEKLPTFKWLAATPLPDHLAVVIQCARASE
jgi:hypothetical protein